MRRALSKIKSGSQNGHIDIFLTDDCEIKKLKGQYFGIRRATDVMAFPELSRKERTVFRSGKRNKLGEVIISLDTAKRQARQRNIPIAWELTLLALHGCLHLKGLDDTSMAGWKKMRTREFETMVRILNL